jgi:putative intracellular protease/amidase
MVSSIATVNGPKNKKHSTTSTKDKVMKVLMVITSHDQLGNTGRKTGLGLEELGAPYYVFKDAGVEITVASPKSGRPRSIPRATNPNPVLISPSGSRRTQPRKLSSAKPFASTASIRKTSTPSFTPGGHGPMWDLAEDEHSIKLIEWFIAASKPIGIVCHSTVALHRVKTTDGKFLVKGKEVTGFTNGEEEEMGLTKVVPFLVEDQMLNWAPSSRRYATGGLTWSATAC